MPKAKLIEVSEKDVIVQDTSYYAYDNSTAVQFFNLNPKNYLGTIKVEHLKIEQAVIKGVPHYYILSPFTREVLKMMYSHKVLKVQKENIELYEKVNHLEDRLHNSFWKRLKYLFTGEL